MIRRPTHPRGYTIRCAACRNQTSDQTDTVSATAERAVHAARTLGWLHVRTPHGLGWLCTRHQAWNPTLGRWVPAPRAAPPRSSTPLPGPVTA